MHSVIASRKMISTKINGQLRLKNIHKQYSEALIIPQKYVQNVLSDINHSTDNDLHSDEHATVKEHKLQQHSVMVGHQSREILTKYQKNELVLKHKKNTQLMLHYLHSELLCSQN